LNAYAALKALVLPGGNTAVTLATKMLAGVFGCVPAYDTYFRLGIRSVASDHSRERFWNFSRQSLELVAEFYAANRSHVDELAAESKSWRFADDGTPTGLPLTKAKILDMYFFNLGSWPTELDGDGGK
jgi:hypothetical protein